MGICFKDRGWYPREVEGEDWLPKAEDDTTRKSGKVYNKILANILKTLKVNEDSRQQELAIKILSACPELVAGSVPFSFCVLSLPYVGTGIGRPRLSLWNPVYRRNGSRTSRYLAISSLCRCPPRCSSCRTRNFISPRHRRSLTSSKTSYLQLAQRTTSPRVYNHPQEWSSTVVHWPWRNVSTSSARCMISSELLLGLWRRTKSMASGTSAVRSSSGKCAVASQSSRLLSGSRNRNSQGHKDRSTRPKWRCSPRRPRDCCGCTTDACLPLSRKLALMWVNSCTLFRRKHKQEAREAGVQRGVRRTNCLMRLHACIAFSNCIF